MKTYEKLMEKRFVCNAVKWFDKVNGNTYHSVRVTRCKDNAVIVGAFEYGYGDQYQQTALNAMQKAGWIPEGDTYLYERNNNYPIIWSVVNGLKRECKANGVL